MFKIKTMNNISPLGVEVLTKKGCTVGPDTEGPEAMLIRSAELHGLAFNPELLAIARAGAGYNNIPIEECAEKGVVVFNSPGANAEAVKELELCSLVMASRDVLGSIGWVRSIAGRGGEIPELVEKGKNNFAGPELLGKTLGVIGLGAVGALVANIALELGMVVYGYDPFMSVDAAWKLSREVIHAESVDEIYEQADYISINVPHTEKTHHMFNAQAFAKMKKGVRLINISRGAVVDTDALYDALVSGQVAYAAMDVTDPEPLPGEHKLLTLENVTVTPHMASATRETRDAMAMLTADNILAGLQGQPLPAQVKLK